MEHEHQFRVSQCEEGCGCDYLFVSCEDPNCEIQMYIAEGWDNCNVDWEYWVHEDPSHLKSIARKLDEDDSSDCSA